MIGVIAVENDLEVAREFFELFKTPWEPCRSGRRYTVVLSASPTVRVPEAALSIVYGLEPKGADGPGSGLVEPPPAGIPTPAVLFYRGRRFPAYRGCSGFEAEGPGIVTRDGTGQVVGFERSGRVGKIVRIGYDLFREIRFLLTVGQPAEHARIPTLEIHISILRDLIVESGIPLVEIPPVPPDCDLILCLTHDVDFVSIREHRLDRTVVGFVYRATVLSLLRFLKGQLSIGKMLRNLLAVLSLPLVHLGVVRDHFHQFERYRHLEGDLRSTFFLIPYKGVDGESPDGGESRGRAACYDVDDITRETDALTAGGWEIGLHGIDAWRSSAGAVEEKDRVRRKTGSDPAGVRMHWLYFSERTPQVLEEAGFAYDSTWGYNDAVGFRGGTAQVFRPPGVKRLLELPLHLQDTALFLTGRMNLTQKQGIRAIEEIVAEARGTGGVLTVNWHMRSLGPERLWDDSYRYLLRLTKKGTVWTATAGEVVEWFAMRRAAAFSGVDPEDGLIRITGEWRPSLTGLVLRRYNVPSHDTEGGVADVPLFGKLTRAG